MQNSWSNFVFVRLLYVAKSVMWHYAMAITVIDGMVSARQNTKMYCVTIPTAQYTSLPQKCTGATVHTYSDSLTGTFKLIAILKNDIYTLKLVHFLIF